MAGVACLDPGKGLASATESYARSNAYATSVTANPPRHEYDGLTMVQNKRERQPDFATLSESGVVNGLTLALLAIAEMLGVTQLIEDELA